MAELIRRDGNKVEFRVTVPKSDVSSAYNQVWSAVSRDVRVPGFRPGKAPRSVIEKRVGRGYIEGEVRERLLQAFYPQAVRELKLNLVDAQINPESLQEGKDFDFTVQGETYPEVQLSDWKAVELTATAPAITDEVVERTLSDLQERNATFETVERPAEASDMVTIEELGEEGGTYPIYLDVAEEHVRNALLGKSAGDEVTIEVPAHSHGDHEHAAQQVQVRVVDIKHKQLQALDDDFAKTMNFDSIEKLRSDLRSELERRARQEGENARREEFVEKLVQGMQADVPESMVERRREAMLSEVQDDLGRQGVKWEEYETFMREQNKLDDFMADLRKNAEARVKRDLALEQLAEDTKVNLSQAEFDANLNALAQANRVSVQELRSQLGPNGLNGYYATLVREKALTQAVTSLGASQAGGQATEMGPEHAAAIEGSGQPVVEVQPDGAQEAAQATEQAAQDAGQTAQAGEQTEMGLEHAAAIEGSDQPVVEVQPDGAQEAAQATEQAAQDAEKGQ